MSVVIESADHQETWELTDVQASRLPQADDLREMFPVPPPKRMRGYGPDAEAETPPAAAKPTTLTLQVGMLGAAAVEYASCENPSRDFALSGVPAVAAMQRDTLDFLGVDKDTLQTAAQIRDEARDEALDNARKRDYVLFQSIRLIHRPTAVAVAAVAAVQVLIQTNFTYVARDFDFHSMAKYGGRIKTMDDLVERFEGPDDVMGVMGIDDYLGRMVDVDKKQQQQHLKNGGTAERRRMCISARVHLSGILPESIRVYRHLVRLV